MRTTETVELNLPSLPTNAKIAHRLPGLKNNLLSAPVLCDSGCTVTFSSDNVKVTKDNQLLMEGWRDPVNRLWRVPITPTTAASVSQRNYNYYDVLQNGTPNDTANAMHECTSEKQLILFYHATCFSPTKSTWIDAIRKGFFKGWPGLTAALVSKHLQIEIATEKGHLDQRRQNLRSTKTRKMQSLENSNEFLPIQEPLNERTHEVFMAVHEVSGKIYSDQTGRFPHTSSRGMKYVMIFYVYDANYVKGIAMKN